MTYLHDLMRDSEAAVLGRLFVGEEVLATGRCADITTTGDLDSAGAGWTYVMITDRRVLWVPSIRKSVGTCALDLDAIRWCNEVHWRHRCAIAMHHDPLVREYFAPNGRQQNWEYASMGMVRGPLSKTILGFSRSTTAATEEMKEQLAARGVEVRRVESSDRLP
jgi:hypothetical protein